MHCFPAQHPLKVYEKQRPPLSSEAHASISCAIKFRLFDSCRLNPIRIVGQRWIQKAASVILGSLGLLRSFGSDETGSLSRDSTCGAGLLVTKKIAQGLTLC